MTYQHQQQQQEEERNTSYRTLRQTAQNSTSVTIPFYFIERLGWQRTDTIRVTIQDEKRVILERVEIAGGEQPHQ